MTNTTEAPREALPEPLKVVAWWIEPLGLAHRDKPHPSYKAEPVVRLTDAQSALESERQAHAAEVERLRADAERYRALVQLRTFSSDECHWNGPGSRKRHLIDAAIDQAIARGKT